jgi:hypothetical protein
MAKYPYPYLECGTHGEKRIGYVACVHVLKLRTGPVRIAVTRVDPPTRTEAGLLLCALCDRNGPSGTPTEDLTTVCGQCLVERGVIESVPDL